MTETNGVIGPRDGVQRPGWMGRVMPGFEARVVDEHDVEVPDGHAGRARRARRRALGLRRPATGGLPEATAAAWRNGWFHTGDRVVARRGRLVPRSSTGSKDAIRRRGENISSWEVEQVLLRHPAVARPRPSSRCPPSSARTTSWRSSSSATGETLDPAELVRFCEPLLASFAIPRYVELVDALPLTENGKVRKVELRERGIGPATWDREAAGVELPRAPRASDLQVDAHAAR